MALGKLPTRQSLSSLWSACCLILITQLERVSPYDDEVSPHVPDSNKCGMRPAETGPQINLFTTQIANTNHHIRSLITKLYRFPSILRTIYITSLYDNKHTIGLLHSRTRDRLEYLFVSPQGSPPVRRESRGP